MTTDLQAKLQEWARDEVRELAEYAALCTDTCPHGRPELFPLQYWPLVLDTWKPKVKEIWAQYTPERLEEIIPLTLKMDISTEDDQRKLEEPYIRASLFANIQVFHDRDRDDAPKLKGHVYDLELKEGEDRTPLQSKKQRFTMNERAFLQAKCAIMERQGRKLAHIVVH